MAFQHIEEPFYIEPYGGGGGGGGGGYQRHTPVIHKHHEPEGSFLKVYGHDNDHYNERHVPFPKYHAPQQGVYQKARHVNFDEPEQGVYQKARHVNFDEPEQGVYQKVRQVNFDEPSSYGGHKKIDVEESVDHDADNYIKSIHKRFENRLWKTFRK